MIRCVVHSTREDATQDAKPPQGQLFACKETQIHSPEEASDAAKKHTVLKGNHSITQNANLHGRQKVPSKVLTPKYTYRRPQFLTCENHGPELLLNIIHSRGQ